VKFILKCCNFLEPKWLDDIKKFEQVHKIWSYRSGVAPKKACTANFSISKILIADCYILHWSCIFRSCKAIYTLYKLNYKKYHYLRRQMHLRTLMTVIIWVNTLTFQQCCPGFFSALRTIFWACAQSFLVDCARVHTNFRSSAQVHKFFIVVHMHFWDKTLKIWSFLSSPR